MVVTGFTMAAVMSLVTLRLRNRFVVPLGAAIALGYIGVAAALFQRGWIVNAVDPPVALAFAMVAGLVYRVASERAAQQEVIELFGRHVTSQVAEELVRQADTGELQLGGETREITALFADIRGFTTLSGGMDPSVLVRLLNERFSLIVDVVADHDGIVNKFIGDALVAFWNAPRDQADHAYLASRAAMAALERLEQLPEDGYAIRFGFGVNTGPALAGNIGSAGRFEYTVMGETVNTASRLSGAAGGGEVWVGERTHELIAGRIGSDELPPQQLKGMIAPIAMYRLHRVEAAVERAAADQALAGATA
jgi:adenylate cyclase